MNANRIARLDEHARFHVREDREDYDATEDRAEHFCQAQRLVGDALNLAGLLLASLEDQVDERDGDAGRQPGPRNESGPFLMERAARVLQDLRRLRGREITRRGLAAFRDDVEAHALSFRERIHPGAFDGGPMDEYVLRAVLGLNEPESTGRVKKFHSSNSH